MAKKITTYTIFNKVIHENPHQEEITHKDILPSNAEQLYHDILTDIETNNTDSVKSLLTQDFIYSKPGQIKEHEQPGDHYSRYCKTQNWITRPVSEVLFFEHNHLFQLIVAAVSASTSAMHDGFINCLKNTDIPMDIFKPWGEEEIAQIQKGVEEIQKYSKDQKPGWEVRRQHSTELSIILTDALRQFPKVESTSTSAVKWLDFKFKFMTKLHSKDEHFVGHLGWKRVIGNIASIIFSGFILNLLNFAVTGNFWFFNQAKTQNLIADIDGNTRTRQLSGQSQTPEVEIEPDPPETDNSYIIGILNSPFGF